MQLQKFTTPFPRIVIWAALCALVLSFGYSFYYHDRPRVDARAYDTIAQNLASGYGYVEDRALALTPEKDDGIIRVGPGYEFFLAGVYTIFGYHIQFAWMLQAVLRALSVLVVFLLARALFSEDDRIAKIAAWVFALSPDLIVISGLLLTETLFIFLTLLAVLCSVWALDRGRKMALLSGLVWALAILTRPVAIVPLIIVTGLLLLSQQWKKVVLVLLPPILIVGSWSYIMSHRYGSFVLTTTAGGYDLWVGNNLGATGGFAKTPEIQALRDVTHSVELEKIAKREYWAYLTTHPVDFALLQIKKTTLYFSMIRPTGFWTHLMGRPIDRLVTASLSALWTCVVFVLGIWGLLSFALQRRDKAYWLVALITLAQPASVIPIIVETRYRYVLYPLLVIFVSAICIEARKGNASRKALVSTILFLGLCTAGDIYFHLPDILEKMNTIFAFLK